LFLEAIGEILTGIKPNFEGDLGDRACAFGFEHSPGVMQAALRLVAMTRFLITEESLK
jgi:hypothetical protein